MKDRNKIMKNIVVNVLELMPAKNDTMYITLEDYEEMLILELDITLKVRDLQ